MTLIEATYRPCLRPLEVVPVSESDGMAIALRDPSGLSDVVLSMSVPALQLLALMDGSNTLDDVRRKFHQHVGAPVAEETVQKLVDHLEKARFLEGPAFEAHYESLFKAYRRSGVRTMPHAAQLGLNDGSGVVFDEILSESNGQSSQAVGPIRGLIAPHLDYPRGRPCYAEAYGLLRGQPPPDRVVILGTNHCGRSTSVVATGNDFETPLGRTGVDRAFIERLEAQCGDLRRFELDHAREHSVELQVAFLQHLFGEDQFALVPFLCPDPCGPTGTAPRDGNGADLKHFAMVLSELIAEDNGSTLVVAGADMSHVGAAFGDDRPLDEPFLNEVGEQDRQALEWIEMNDPDAFVRCVTENDNATRLCSVGCMYVARQALADADARVLRYHQAVDQETQCCVTCAAVVFV
jgi:MEMO1 family protein